MFKKMQMLGVTVVIMALLMASCAQATTAPTAAPTEAQQAATTAPASTEAATTAATPTQSDDVITVTAASQSGTTFTPNFNPFSAGCLFPTVDGIFEPLMINNIMTGKIVPWLASSYTWSTDLLTLTFTLRSDVKWSDGQPFSADDVAYTFNLLKSNSSLQGTGQLAVGQGGYVDSVTASDPTTVVFKFNKVYVPGLYDIVDQVIVPQHIWTNVADPVKETNDNPVGTGPFTQVTNFTAQAYEVDRNPNYWQPGEPYIKGVRDVTFSGNDTAAAMFVNGDTDWTGQFFPNVDTAVVAKNTADLHCWWPIVTSTAMFMMNTTEKPFDDPIVRKAISMSFDRNALIQVALQGHSQPADVTGLSSGFSSVKVADPSSLGDWTTYNPDEANKMLDDAGYKKGSDGFRTQKDGTPMKFELLEINGFTDWTAEAPLMQQELQAIGLNVYINSYDVPIAFDKWEKGNFDMGMFFGITSDTIYTYYRDIMSSETVVPVGTSTPLAINMWRYANTDADAALQQYASTNDPTIQKQAADALQKIFADNAPIIPMYGAPTFYCYNDSKVTGWPNADNPYAYPMPIATVNVESSQLITMLALHSK